MPTIIIIEGFRFHFFSNENDEPPHIHIKKGSGDAKFWLTPEVELAEFYNLKSQELKKIWRLVEENRELLIEKWNEYFDKY